jgi:large subunit ribosomal protein L15
VLVAPRAVTVSRPVSRTVVVTAVAEAAEGRLRLNNLAPQPGSRRPNKRKGRGHAAGQVWRLCYLAG